MSVVCAIMFLCSIVLISVLCNLGSSYGSSDHWRMKCLICKASVQEFAKFINKLDPNIHIPVGSYVIDGNGNEAQKLISQTKSEHKLYDLLDKVCPKLEDYVRAKNKTTGTFTLLKVVDDDNKLAFDTSQIEIVPDENQNRGIKYVCEELISEYSDEIVDIFKNSEGQNVENEICVETAQFCPRGTYPATNVEL